MESESDATAAQGHEAQKQHRFILYQRNDSAPWTYDRILSVVRSIVFEAEPFPISLFTSLNKQSTLRPENFEYLPSSREWDWLQYHLDNGGGFLKTVVDSKIASAIFYHFCRQRQTTVRGLAVKMNKYDSEVRRWIDKFCRAQLLRIGKAWNHTEKPFRLNMDFKLQHTLLLDLIQERYTEKNLQQMMMLGMGGSKVRDAAKKRSRKYRSSQYRRAA